MEKAIFSALVFVLGACIGSFLNVVVYRLPAGISLLWPPSRCPHCLHKLGKVENVPVLGWLWLRGRCRWCQAPISPRYPLVEATTGILFCFLFWQFDFSLDTLAYWTFASWLLALSLIDLDTMTLPNSMTQSGLVLGLGFQTLRGWQAGQLPGLAQYVFLGILAVVVGIWFFDLVAIIGSLILGQPAMGGGDAKLLAMIGAWLGWKYMLVTGLLACALGALVGGGAIATGLLARRQPMPFGPFLALGAVLTVFWGEVILSTYLDLFIAL